MILERTSFTKCGKDDFEEEMSVLFMFMKKGTAYIVAVMGKIYVKGSKQALYLETSSKFLYRPMSWVSLKSIFHNTFGYNYCMKKMKQLVILHLLI